MVKFADEVVRYRDAEKLANEQNQEKEKKDIFIPGSSNIPDFSTERMQEREI
jgi:hypothetical protein